MGTTLTETCHQALVATHKNVVTRTTTQILTVILAVGVDTTFQVGTLFNLL